MGPVGIRVSDEGQLQFPFREPDEIIAKLIVPAATTMQALSKWGTHQDFHASCQRNMTQVIWDTWNASSWS